MNVDIPQVLLVILGGSSIYLVGRTDRWQRCGYITGLLSQPFWFYATIKAQQWGMIVLCCWYTFAWGQGFWNHWVQKELRVR